MNKLQKLFILIFVSVCSMQNMFAQFISAATLNTPSHNTTELMNLHRSSMNPSDGLYEYSWNNNRVHCYSEIEAPNKFIINLKNFAMPTTNKVVTSKYGYRPKFKRYHKGIDIKVYIGDTIVAAFDGKVRIVKYEPKGYGNYVVIRHNNGLETVYGHLSKHLVKENQIVRAGEPIGLGGNTGRSTGSHLHFETRLLGIAIDPSLLFDFSYQDVTGDTYSFVK